MSVPEIVIQDFCGAHNGDLSKSGARFKGVCKWLVQKTVSPIIRFVQETWKRIKGWPAYQISTLGRVRSFWVPFWPVGRKGRNYRLSSKPHIIKLKVNRRDGRHNVSLHKAGKRKMFSVHTLVLKHFVGPRPKGMYGCHGPAGIGNDSLSNVYWDTPKRNNGEDRYRDKTAMFGEGHPRALLTEKDVLKVLSDRAKGETRHAIARRLGVSPGTIGGIIYGKTWRHVAR